MTSPAPHLRERARHLYHRQGRTARRVARQLEIPLDEVLKLVADQLPACRQCGVELSRPGQRYCSTECYHAKQAERRAKEVIRDRACGASGCGCTDERLCQRHRDLLKRLRAA